MVNNLEIIKVPVDVQVKIPEDAELIKVSASDSAMTIFTDFKKTRVFTISPLEKMEGINLKMIAIGVRLLFVIDDGEVIGLVTSTDILGNKPVLYVTERRGNREDITARDLMTPMDSLEAVEYEKLKASTVGDVVEIMIKVNRHHMLVLESFGGMPYIRGLLSLNRISSQLGEQIQLV